MKTYHSGGLDTVLLVVMCQNGFETMKFMKTYQNGFETKYGRKPVKIVLKHLPTKTVFCKFKYK